jgi:hypothetical protein
MAIALCGVAVVAMMEVEMKLCKSNKRHDEENDRKKMLQR